MTERSVFKRVHGSVSAVGNWWWLIGYGGALWAAMSWVASHVAIFGKYGWAVDVLAGVVFASLLLASTGMMLIGWRYFRPLPTSTQMSSPVLQRGMVPLPIRRDNQQRMQPVPGESVDRMKESTERLLVQRSASELMAYYRDLTPLQASKLIEPYVGRWINVTGTVLTLLDGGADVVAVLRGDGIQVECRFDKAHENTLMTYQIGDHISLVGRIRPNQNGQQLYLDKCELLEQQP